MTYVYVMSAATPPLKVGFSSNPKARLQTVQAVARVPMRLSAVLRFDHEVSNIERRAHRILAPYCDSGEWFNVRPSVAVAAIKRAAVELAFERTTQKLPEGWYCARPECQAAYRKILARYDSTGALRRAHEIEVAREAGRAAARARKKLLKEITS